MNLISKKDLLAITGISYGQLYRWKRERLIPEEWFIKQSAYTGQETFFPREQILSRIQSILDLKDQYSLEELAKILSPHTTQATVSLQELKEIEEIEEKLLKHLQEARGKERYDFKETAFLIFVSQASKTLEMTEEQAAELLSKSIPALARQMTDNVTCTIFQAGGEYHTVFSSSNVSMIFDDDIDTVERKSISETVDMLKTKYKYIFIK